ncbi:MAG TPA: TPM domain-containing protein [Thermoanaerobaculia bacterium]
MAWAAYVLGLNFGGFVLRTAIAWNKAFPNMSEKSLIASVFFVLGVFTNVVFCFTSVARATHLPATSWKVLMAGSLVINLTLLIFFPVFAQNAGYWFWLIAFALATWALIFLPAEEPIIEGGVPAILWVWVGCTVFWLMVMVIGYYRPGTKAPSVADTLKPAALTSYVTDPGRLLPAGQQEAWTSKLQNFEHQTSDQVAVAIYLRCPSPSIEDFTVRVAEASGFGQRGVDNGVVLFVFVAERTARIEVGYGLEGALPDGLAHRILAVQEPRFARGEYQDGIDGTLSAVLQAISGEYSDTDRRSDLRRYIAHLYPQLKVAIVKCARRAWPLIRDSPLQARLGISFFGSLLGLGVADGVANAARILWDAILGVSNLIRRRRFRTGMAPFQLGSIGDTVKLVVILAVVAGGFVIVAGQGSFGGAGAMIRWPAVAASH